VAAAPVACQRWVCYRPPNVSLVVAFAGLVAVGADEFDLPELVDLALERNLQIEASVSQVAEAEALLDQAAAASFPQFNLRTLIGGPTAEARTTVQNDVSTVTPESLGGDLDFGELGVAVRGGAQLFVPISTFGKIKRAKRATRNLVEASEHKADVTRAQVVYDVNRAFWTVQLVESLLESLADGRETLAGILNRIEELLEAESLQVTENDRLRLVYVLRTLDVRAAEAKAARKQAVAALQLLTGLPRGAELSVVIRPLYRAIPESAPPLELVVERAKSGRPDLAALRAVVDAQKAFAQFRKAGLLPDFLLGALVDFAYQSNATDQTNPFIFDPYNILDFGLGVGLRWEINLAQKLAELEQAKAELRTRRVQEQLATGAAELEVRAIHAELEGNLQRLRELGRANRAASGWLTSNVLAYDIGTGDAAELIDAFLAWAASEAEIQTVRYDTILALANLARATGRLAREGAASGLDLVP
jgi:outer membrane protein TolC